MYGGEVAAPEQGDTAMWLIAPAPRELCWLPEVRFFCYGMLQGLFCTALNLTVF